MSNVLKPDGDSIAGNGYAYACCPLAGEEIKNLIAMCLYPRRMRNKKYTATKKNERVMPYNNEGIAIYNEIPNCEDERCQWVNVPCGHCKECRDEKAREWQVRLYEEQSEWKYKYFVTLTFAPEELNILCRKTKQAESNFIAGYAVRHMLERWRKDHKKSIRHWLITELGHEGTERIHLHGLVFTNEELQFEIIEKKHEGAMVRWKYWKYGTMFVGDYVNAKTINYVVKYVNKIDKDHIGFEGQILCSPGIGKNWILRHENDITYKYTPGKTRNDYRAKNGAKIALPTYYRNHLFNENEREMLWRDSMDTDKTIIMGNTYQHADNKTLSKVTKKAKENNSELGYGTNDIFWKKRPHNVTERQLKSTFKKEFAEKLQKNLHI